MTWLRKIYTLLCEPRLLHYTLPVVMIYLVAGTIAQKYIGLYDATHVYFLSPVFMFFGVPLPGMPVFLGLIFLNLTFKLAFKSPWRIQNAGIIITHIGVMLLLVGGLISAAFSTEGYLTLPLHQKNNTVSDYHIREFVILDNEDRVHTAQQHGEITTGHFAGLKNLPFTLEILETCRNCSINSRENPDETYEGMAQHMQLSSAPPRQRNEDNLAGMTFRITYGDNVSRVHTILEEIPQIPEITINETSYRFILRRQAYTLPFTIELLDFKKETHPGTRMARAYQSTVLIKDGDSVWESVISMNEPLRYKGYTFFQSSFIAAPDGDISVLAVVWNVGRAFPYISGLTMCLGLILHLVIRRRYNYSAIPTQAGGQTDA